MRIADRELSPDAPAFCIAEAGVNHNGDLKLAKALVDAAAEAGADAVKFQTFRAEDLVAAGTEMAEYQKANTGKQESQFEMLKRLELGERQHFVLRDHCRKRGIQFLSTPHSGKDSLDLLGRVGVLAYKVASGDLTNHPFLVQLAAKGRPVILSTGMASLEEVVEAVALLRGGGARDLVVLQCTTQYPCPPEDVNLKAMLSIGEACRTPVGFSDHTEGLEAGVLAVRLGAVLVEKHLTLDRDLPGPDHKASLEPGEFALFVAALKAERRKSGSAAGIDESRLKRMLGSGEKRPTPAERRIAAVARKSVVTARSLAAGAALGEGDLAVKRPGSGIAPRHLAGLAGRRLKRALPADRPLAWEDLE